MSFRRTIVSVTVALILVSSRATSAQGLQTGSLTGIVTDDYNLPLPNVTVTVQSRALQGTRSTKSDANGVYTIQGLPPGEYSVRVELPNGRSIVMRRQVDLGLPARLDAELPADALSETVTVTADLPSVVTAVSGGANYRGEMIDRLASSRTVQSVAELAPGLTINTPNAGQVTISGGFAYDTQFLIDGVDVADNVFGTANNLFIEDALEEVQVLTSGISAEYGRFGGGVVQAISKTGSNRFAGSLRDNLYKPSWTASTPFERGRDLDRSGPLQSVFEWTLGGPLLADRVWFFHSGRRQRSNTPTPFPQTGLANSTRADNTRVEMKATATVLPDHTIQAQFLRNHTEQVQPSFLYSIDPSTVIRRALPNQLAVANWRGVLGTKAFATAQASRRRFAFDGSGGTSRNLLDSPFVTRGFSAGVPQPLHFNAPFFDATDPESRNNRQVAASVSYFLTTAAMGSHDVKVGYEHFLTSRIGGNSQSATDYVFQTDYVVSGGVPVLSADRRPVPVFVPGFSRAQRWLATRGAQLDITTQSIFVQDRWALRRRLSFDLGVRGEFVRSQATGDIVSVDTSTWVPRLGVSWDATGDGSTVAQLTYGRYGSKYAEPQVGRNTPVGTPSLLTYEYQGPAGQGLDFAPGVNLTNYRIISGNFPLEGVSFEEGLRAPTTDEFTVAVGRQFGVRGGMKASYQWRSLSGLIENFIDDPGAGGKTTIVRDGVNLGTFDRVVWRNSNQPVRAYQALVFQADQRLARAWTLNGHWTVQLRNHGNFEGEAPNQPGAASVIGNYPELFGSRWDRQNPLGRFDDFQRHKLRVWTTHSSTLGRFGTLDVSALYRFNSALTYSVTAPAQALSAIQLARDPGYARASGVAQTLYFGERGTEGFNGWSQVDLAVLYQVPVRSTLRPFVKLELYNAFKSEALVGFNTTVTPDANSLRDADGLPTGFLRAEAFGTPRGVSDYPRATTTPSGTAVYSRTFLMSAGVRF